MKSAVFSFATAATMAASAFLSGAADLSAQEVDISGVWIFQVELDAGGGTPTVTIAQDGEELTGRYESAQLGNSDMTGTIEGSEFVLTFAVSMEGLPLTVTLNGTVEGPEELRGTFDLGGFAAGTFTGRPREEP
jgi:hypothetical protein